MLTRSGRIAAYTILLALLGACGDSTQRLFVQFEADTLNSTPDSSPNGLPADSLVVAQQASAAINFTVINQDPLVGSKSLRFQNAGNPQALLLNSEPLADGTQPLSVTWTGRIAPDTRALIKVHTRFFVQEGALGGQVVRVDLNNGSVVVNGDSIGTYTAGRPHIVTVRLEPDATYNLSFVEVTGTGANALLSDAGAFLDGTVLGLPYPAFEAPLLPPDRIHLSVDLIAQSPVPGDLNDYYDIDNIRVFEDNPD